MSSSEVESIVWILLAKDSKQAAVNFVRIWLQLKIYICFALLIVSSLMPDPTLSVMHKFLIVYVDKIFTLFKKHMLISVKSTLVVKCDIES